jgi:hypothetical protein
MGRLVRIRAQPSSPRDGVIVNVAQEGFHLPVDGALVGDKLLEFGPQCPKKPSNRSLLFPEFCI